MRHKNLIRVALAAALAALAIAAIPALAGAKDHGRDDHGHHEGEHQHHRHFHHIHRFGGEATGTISSFDATTGKLTIMASNGDAVTGLVTASTEIRCEGRDDSRFARRDGGGSDNSGSGGSGSSGNSGPGSGGQSEPGDDNGGRGEPEPGDDHGVREPEPGDDHGEDGVGGEEGEATCSTASLVTDAVVEEADVVVRGGASLFDEIELAHTS